jgi:small-conductance mechanosensitive channel
MVQDIIENQEDLTRFERAHFHAFGDSKLMFEILYWVLSPDHDTYMDIHHINFAILRAFEREGIEFTFPIQTLTFLISRRRWASLRRRCFSACGPLP